MQRLDDAAGPRAGISYLGSGVPFAACWTQVAIRTLKTNGNPQFIFSKNGTNTWLSCWCKRVYLWSGWTFTAWETDVSWNALQNRNNSFPRWNNTPHHKPWTPRKYVFDITFVGQRKYILTSLPLVSGNTYLTSLPLVSGNTYLTSLPFVNVCCHGRVTQWKSR